MLKFLDQQRSDEALLHRCATRLDRDAFAVVYERHRQRFYQFLLKLSADPRIAEDVSQQCWLKLLESFSGTPVYQPSKHARFTTFLYTLGRNLYIDQFVRRHDHSRCQSLEHTPAAQNRLSEHCVQSATHEQQLEQHTTSALRQLPVEQREVVSLWACGFSARSIAAIAGVPVNTVHSRKRYAIARLRELFAQSGLLDSAPVRGNAPLKALKNAVAGQTR